MPADAVHNELKDSILLNQTIVESVEIGLMKANINYNLRKVHVDEDSNEICILQIADQHKEVVYRIIANINKDNAATANRIEFLKTHLSNEALLAIILNPEDWQEGDAKIARKLLKDEGLDYVKLSKQVLKSNNRPMNWSFTNYSIKKAVLLFLVLSCILIGLFLSFS
jgi:hypothetical protein